MGQLSRKAAIVGVDESDEIGIVPDKSRLQHAAEASFRALENAGLRLDDVDAVFMAGPSPYDIAEYLGIVPKYTDGTNVGGSSFVIHVEHAISAISAGLIDVALIVHGESGRSSRAYAARDPNLPSSQYEHPYGLVIPPHTYAMACSRYMHEFGQERTQNALAEIAVSTRKWAQLNPKAINRDPMTLDDYHESRLISWPFHILDCCLVTDGGGLSYTHTGMYGMFLLLEATRQLRGECGDRQVEGAKLAMVNGTGGILSSCGTLVLGAD